LDLDVSLRVFFIPGWKFSKRPDWVDHQLALIPFEAEVLAGFRPGKVQTSKILVAGEFWLGPVVV